MGDAALPFDNQKQELHRIGQGLAPVLLQFLVQAGQGGAHGLSAHFLAEQLPGQALGFPGADAVQKEPANSGVHVPAPVFIQVKDCEFHAALVQAGHLDILDRAELGEQVPEIVTVAIPLPLATPFVGPGPDPSGDFLS